MIGSSRRDGRCLRWLGFALAVGGCGTAGAEWHTLTFRALDEATGAPLSGACIQVTVKSGRVGPLDYPPGKKDFHLTGRGIQVDDTGAVTVMLEPGEYSVKVSHDAFKAQTDTVRVPHPDLPDETELTYEWSLRMREEVMARWLLVRVYSRSRDAEGREQVRPFGKLSVGDPGHESPGLLDHLLVERAEVDVSDENGESLGGWFTNGMGFYGLKSPRLVVGEMVTVKAKAPGHLPAETQLLVGSSQEAPTIGDISIMDVGIPSFLPVGAGAATTRWDVALVTLDRAGGTTGLIVEAAHKTTGEGVGSAQVEVSRFNGTVLATGQTGPYGATPPLAVPLNPDGSAPTDLRVKVTCRGYEEAWSDIPPDYLNASAAEPQRYLVNLTPTGATSGCPDMEGCRQGAVEAYERFAKARDARPFHYGAGIVKPLVWLAQPPLVDPGQVLWVDVGAGPANGDEWCQDYLERHRQQQNAQSFAVSGHEVVYVPLTTHWAQRHCIWSFIVAASEPAPSIEQRLNIVKEVIAAVGECMGATGE